MKRLILILSLAVSLHSAHAQYTDWYCNSTGTNVNAGSTTNAVPTFSATGGNFTNATGAYFKSGIDLSAVSVGMWASVYPDGETVTPFVGRIVSVNDAADWFAVTNTAGAGTKPSDGTGNRSVNVGGAWYGMRSTTTMSEQFPFGFLQNNMTNTPALLPRILFKSDRTYTINSNLWHSNLLGYVRFEGYTNTPGDGGKVHFLGDTNNTSVFYYVPFTFHGGGYDFNHILFSGRCTNSDGTIHTNGVQTFGSIRFFQCIFSNFFETGLELNQLSAAGRATLIECEAVGCNINGANAMAGIEVNCDAVLTRVWSHGTLTSTNRRDTDQDGFSAAAAITVVFDECLSTGNWGNGWKLGGSTAFITLKRCVSAFNQAHGVAITSLNSSNFSYIEIENTIIASNNWAVANLQTVTNWALPNLRNVAVCANTGTFSNVNPSRITGTINLSSMPFVDPATGDYSLNNTANGGALLKATGRGSFTQSGDYMTSLIQSLPDVGAVQGASTNGGTTTTLTGPQILW